MPTLLKHTNSDFIEEHYKEQIIALDLFFKESGAKHIPSSKIIFGGGTALAIYYFQHRLSFDIDNSKKLVDFDLYIEDITDIIAKKITFRKKDNKTRDIIDIAICLKSNPNLFNELIELEKVTKDDLKILKESLLQLNKNRYLSQLNIVKPFEKYIELSKKAPEYLISKIC